MESDLLRSERPPAFCRGSTWRDSVAPLPNNGNPSCGLEAYSFPGKAAYVGAFSRGRNVYFQDDSTVVYVGWRQVHGHSNHYRMEAAVANRPYIVAGKEKAIEIQDDTWVLTGHSPSNTAFGATTVGSGRVREELVDVTQEYVTRLYYSHAPFGRVIYVLGEPRLSLVCARQVHKGELGARPTPPETPRYVRQAASNPHQRGKRGHHGWGKLEDLARIMKCDPFGLLERYWGFIGLGPDHYYLDFLVTEKPDGIRKERLKPFRVLQPNHLFDHTNGNTSNVWVQRRLCNTLLLLRMFGVESDRQWTAKQVHERESIQL